MGGIGAAVVLTIYGRSEEAAEAGERALAAARAEGSIFWTAFSLWAYGFAAAQHDPELGIRQLREGLALGRSHGLPFIEATCAREAAGIEALHGDPAEALSLSATTIELFHRSGDRVNLAPALGHLAVLLDRMGRPAAAARIAGAAAGLVTLGTVAAMPECLAHLRAVLGEEAFEREHAAGRALDPAGIIAEARQQLAAARAVLRP
jgi:hypothetical protein